jgi:UDP-glucose 4-epimerase
VKDESFNVGTGVQTTINELVGELLKITGSTLEIDYRPNEQMFVTNRVGSTEKAKRLLGFEARTALAEGLRSVVEWRAGDRRATAAGPSS